ncbi:MAG: hypothetical protein WCJ01_10075, partial [Ignavibacteria bacterium]
ILQVRDMSSNVFLPILQVQDMSSSNNYQVNTILRPCRAYRLLFCFSMGCLPIAYIFRPFRADTALKGRNIIAQGNRPVENEYPTQPKALQGRNKSFEP